jgi:hypothetical protein
MEQILEMLAWGVAAGIIGGVTVFCVILGLELSSTVARVLVSALTKKRGKSS